MSPERHSGRRVARSRARKREATSIESKWNKPAKTPVPLLRPLNHLASAGDQPRDEINGNRPMTTLSRIATRDVNKVSYRQASLQLVWLGAAVLFVTMLYLSYGLDLSPGFF
jgi:hypothetical protein